MLAGSTHTRLHRRSRASVMTDERAPEAAGDPGIAMNCPYRGARLVYLRAAGVDPSTYFYRCTTHGVLMLPPDGRVRLVGTRATSPSTRRTSDAPLDDPASCSSSSRARRTTPDSASNCTTTASVRRRVSDFQERGVPDRAAVRPAARCVRGSR